MESIRFKIHQPIPDGEVKGPHSVLHLASLNAIEIKRRYGEGSKPLFSRADITVNQGIGDNHDAESGPHSGLACKSTSSRSSSSEASTIERYRHRENKKVSPINDKNKKSRSPSPVKRTPIEKVPYYRDEQREKDRLRRLYGSAHSRSPSPRRGGSVTKRRVRSTSRRRRSISKERHRKRSPYRSSRRDYRNRRSRTPLRTRSPQRPERRKPSSPKKDRKKEQKADSNSITTPVIPATPQYIPIPMPMPADYAAYSFPSWTAAHPPWNPPPHRPLPPSHYAPYPMWPIIQPMRPPHPSQYVGMSALPYMSMTAQYRPRASQRHPPPRHGSNYYILRKKK